MPKSKYEVEVYRDTAEEWRWRLIHTSNGRQIAESGEGYKRMSTAVYAWNRFLKFIAGAGEAPVRVVQNETPAEQLLIDSQASETLPARLMEGGA